MLLSVVIIGGCNAGDGSGEESECKAGNGAPSGY